MTATPTKPTKATAPKSKQSKVSRKVTSVVLPRSVITAAAQFTSRDACKMILQCIHIYYESKEKKTIVVSSDGHRLFRCKLPGRLVTEPLRLYHKKDLRIFSGKATRIKFDLQHRSDYYSSKDKLSHYLVPTFYLDDEGDQTNCITIEDRHDWGDFPHTDQLIPDRKGMGQDNVMYNAFYLGEFCKVANKFSQFNHIKQVLSSPNTPNLFECDVELPDPFGDTVKFELLLMPVQQR